MTRNQIIENLFTGKNFNDCICKMEPQHLQDDLKMEVISIVCEWPDEKIIGLYERRELEFYVVRVILNQVKSNTSPFTKKYRQFTSEIKEHYVDFYSNVSERTTKKCGDESNKSVQNLYDKRYLKHNEESNASDIDQRIVRETLESIAMSEIDKLYWYDAEMIRLYLKLGSFRAIEDHTGIPFISCYKNIKKSLNTLKKKAIEQAMPIFSKEELSFIQNNKPCRDI